MNMKKYIMQGFMAMVLGSTLLASNVAMAAEDVSAPTNQTVATTEQNGEGVPVKMTYKYTSPRYGYSILCPTKPTGIIPASMLNDGDKGDVLIFDSEGMDIKKGWIICINAYDDTVVPTNLGEMNDQETEEFTKSFADKYAFDFVRVITVKNEDGTTKYGVYAVTAKAIQVDSDGDGELDSVAEADNQMVKIFMPGEYGGHFVLGLMDNPQLSQQGMAEFNAAATTLQEWPTSAYNKAKEEAAKNPKKKK